MKDKEKPTLREILLEFLGDPPMYKGLPVDLSCLDEEIKGFVIKKAEES